MVDLDVSTRFDNNQIFDIAFDDSGDFLMTDSFDTAIKMSFFGEVRADRSEVPSPERRRGWWGNTVNVDNYEFGSKLWLLDQVRATQDTLNKAINYTQLGFQWFVSDNLLSKVEVTGELRPDNVKLAIVLIRSNSIVETRYFDLWQNSGRTFEVAQ